MKKSKKSSRNFFSAALVIFVISALFVLEATNTTYLLHARKAISGTIPTTKQRTAVSNDSTAPVAESKSEKSDLGGASKQADTQNTSNLALIAPYGTLVSNHKPSLGGSPTPSSEQSSCTTTPGASCHIEFKQGSVTKQLSSQIVDSSGSTSWAWDVNKAGLTEGKWEITAIATLDGKSMSTTDAISLEVQK